MSKFSRLLSQLSVVAIFTLAASHAQAIPFTFTAYGTISSGYDSSGLFGLANTALDGLSYRQTISFDPEQNTNNTTNQYYSISDGPGATAFTATEVNGHVFSSEISFAGIGPYASVSNNLTQLGAISPGYSWSDDVFAAACSSPFDTQFICVQQSVSSIISSFIPAATLNQTFSYITQADDTSEVSFYASSTQGLAYFGGTVSAITWNTVPEPATFALIGVGLFGISRLRRRKQA